MSWVLLIKYTACASVRDPFSPQIHAPPLGLGDELTHITRGGTRRPLATIEEVLELKRSVRENGGSSRFQPTPGYPTGQGQRKRAMGQSNGPDSRLTLQPIGSRRLT